MVSLFIVNVGIDTKGPATTTHNLSFSIEHPIFKRAYQKYVYPTLPNDAKEQVRDYVGH